MSVTAVIYLSVFFGCLVKSIMSRPIYGLYAYIVAIYMHAPGSWWGASLPDLRWSFLAAFVTFISVFIHAPREKAIAPELSKISWFSAIHVKLFIGFVVWVWAQNIWAIWPESHFEFTILVTKFLLLIFLINKTIKTLNDFVSVLVVHALGCAFFGYIGLSHGGGRFENVPTPGMHDGNLLSIHMAPFLIAVSYLLLLKVGKIKFLLIPLIVLTLNAIFLTQSRGALASLVVAGLVSIVLVPRYRRKTFILLATLAIVGGLSIVGEQLIERIKYTVESEKQGDMEKSAESRLVIASAQWRMFKESPLLGYGHRGTQYLSPRYLDDEWLTGDSSSRSRASHNLTMTVFVDHGLPGVFLYFGAVISVLLKAFSYRKKIVSLSDPIYILMAGSFLALLVTMLSSQFANSMRLEIGIWWIALAGLLVKWIDLEVNLNWLPKKAS